ncbi:hypothetical protein BOS5A_200708 [Bosea sp. EC-HK365B]|nr:hypothetical protein BOSE21B_110659 [Bosea sp. 21B]CAD5278221.1 hypothetical protein BOSE7B_40557 [Bosea sp. 7B]VVT58683.1 hypothetical protein BOS5A_200708 [Bosea sp. EC-HK365B]VXC80654.1 hypothetical protein BOSE127_50265 [Bosea sp. 127]
MLCSRLAAFVIDQTNACFDAISQCGIALWLGYPSECG